MTLQNCWRKDTEKIEATWSSLLEWAEGSIPCGKKAARIACGAAQPSKVRTPSKEFPYDTVRLDVSKLGRRSNRNDLNRLKMRGFYNVSENVSRDSEGNPTFESIDAEARKLLQTVKAGVYAPEES